MNKRINIFAARTQESDEEVGSTRAMYFTRVNSNFCSKEAKSHLSLSWYRLSEHRIALVNFTVSSRR